MARDRSTLDAGNARRELRHSRRFIQIAACQNGAGESEICALDVRGYVYVYRPISDDWVRLPTKRSAMVGAMVAAGEEP
jgi:hypothetical protein